MRPSSTFSSNQRRAWRVAWRVGLFLVPALAVAAPLEWLLWRSGECWPVTWVAALQRRDPSVLYARRYLAHGYNVYKLARIRQERPAILVVGSSRVMQVREAFFKPLEGEFFNAGGMISGVEDFLQFADMMQQGQIPAPRVLVVGLDPWWIKQGREDSADLLNDVIVWKDALSPNAHLHAMRGLLKERALLKAFRRVHAQPEPESPHPLGLGGVLHGTGFRRDGSYLYQTYLEEYRRSPKYRDHEDPPVLQRVMAREGKFAPAPGVDWVNVGRLLEAFRKLQRRGVEVYVMLPPLTTEVHEALAQAPDLSAWMAECFGPLPELLAREAGIPTVGGVSPAVYGLSDEYMWDGFHPTEVLMSYVVEDLIRAAPASSYLRQIDPAHLPRLRSEPGLLPVVFPSLLAGSRKETDPSRLVTSQSTLVRDPAGAATWR